MTTFEQPAPWLNQQILHLAQHTAVRRGNVFGKKEPRTGFKNTMYFRNYLCRIRDRTQNQRAHHRIDGILGEMELLRTFCSQLVADIVMLRGIM